MIQEFDFYRKKLAKDSLDFAFLQYAFGESKCVLEYDTEGTHNVEFGYHTACQFGYLAECSPESKDLFLTYFLNLSKRQPDPRDTIIIHDKALLGCYVGLKATNQYNESTWFHNLLEIKRNLGGSHADFCDAISDKCPAKGHSMIELYLFLRQKKSAVPIVDSTLREWMLEHWRKPFPYYNDFFRDVIAVRVLNSGIDLILKHLEEKSAKIPLSKSDFLALSEVEVQISKANLPDAIRILGDIINQYGSNPFNNELLHLKSRWHGLWKKRIGELISNSDANIEEGQIREAIVILVQELRGFI